MKRSLILPFILVLAFSFAAMPAHADFVAETYYMEKMLAAVQIGDDAAGHAAQESRSEKIDALELEFEKVDYDELSLLARLIQSEAGSAWLDEHWKMAVGEVVLNRVASPEFPDTIRDVILQQGQYTDAVTWLLPSYESALAAWKLLEGQRVINNPAVVFQSNGHQGSGVFMEMRDAYLGNTYLCFSNRMDLYDE